MSRLIMGKYENINNWLEYTSLKKLTSKVQKVFTYTNTMMWKFKKLLFYNQCSVFYANNFMKYNVESQLTGTYIMTDIVQTR